MKTIGIGTLAVIGFTGYTLFAGTYFLQSLGGADGSPPWPFDPYHGTKPLTEISATTYVVDDLEESISSPMMSDSAMDAASLDPSDPGTNSPDGSLPPAAPNIRNYAKYGAQVFELLDTNAVLNDEEDTNLYDACAAIPAETNGVALLTIRQYGPDAVIIRADNFDYWQTNASFALLVCDNVADPIWKSIDFAHASDAEDGWLVQGTVPNWEVSSTMFMLVTNLNTAYNAFFCAIPYSGPEVEISGTNQPYDTVSNTIAFDAQIYDLSGTTNEQFDVNVNGSPCRYYLGTSNTFTVDTTYSPNQLCNVYLQAVGTSSVNSLTNPPDSAQLYFQTLASMPLYFQNATYLLFQSDDASPYIGTNFIEFYMTEPQTCAAIISHPSTGEIVFAATNDLPASGAIAVPWNFTEADGVTPYTETNYAVEIICNDPQVLNFTNRIDWVGVRFGAGTFLTYEDENPSTVTGGYLNSQASTWATTEQDLFNNMYLWFSLTQYDPSVVGANRNYSSFTDLSPTTPVWQQFLKPALTNQLAPDDCMYSDLTIMQAHGSGGTIGGGPYLTNEFLPLDLGLWVKAAGVVDYRLRKAAFWTCYSSSYDEKFNGLTAIYSTFPEACGIRPEGLQEVSYMRKNCGLFFNGLLPQGGYGGTGSTVTAQAAEGLDQIWVCGKNGYPGGCDPTYSWQFCINAARGLFDPQMDQAGPLLAGLPQMIYSSVYDNQLMALDFVNVKQK